MEMAGLIISCIALFFGIYTYCRHDRKIKIMDKRIKEYQIDSFEKQKIDQKKAIIEANFVKGSNGKRIVKVYNKGKAIARNVNVNFSEMEGVHVSSNPLPIDIRPQNSIDIKIVLFMSSNRKDKIDLTFTWSDDFCESNQSIQTIPLN